MGLEFLIEPFKYDFMLRSLVTAIISGMMLPMLGSFTINRNMGFMADAMAHATMPVIAVGVFFGFSISALGVPAAILVALFLGFVINYIKFFSYLFNSILLFLLIFRKNNYYKFLNFFFRAFGRLVGPFIFKKIKFYKK